MFFCKPCGEQRQWPESGSKSYGRCEVCEKEAVCNDVPAGVLDSWGEIEYSLEHPLTYVRMDRPPRQPEIF